jgi:hypothetical protein
MVPLGFSPSGLRLRVSWPRDRPLSRELVHARGRPQIDKPGQDVDEICLRIDSGQSPDDLNDAGIELDPRCGLKDAGKLDGSRKRVPRTTASRAGGWLPRALGRRQRTLATARRTFVRGWKIYDYEDKAGTPWTTNPLGFPEQ